ncbi:MAG: class I SAM-dependent methyltransferase [Planctomycetota bacterium]|nr:class I SAM-dependent methyltransferase [Planctomycetota bacterium]
MNNTSCPLCSSREFVDFHKDDSRQYLRCEICRLIFVPREYHLSSTDEKSHYDQHENSPDDPGYRRFLGRLFEPMNGRVTAGSRGLDFGSGPGPTLSVMFEEVGHDVSIYDPFYAPDDTLLDRQYDFVTASEVVEHLCNPSEDLHRIWNCVKPGGLLGIMTKQALDQASFPKWHYKNDPTHVSFFSRHTFSWLAAIWSAELTLLGSDVILLAKIRRN